MDSVLLVDKPSGITSFGVVARVRRRLSEQAGKKVKVGHAGTLDPFATGLMIILTGKECKNAGSYMKLDKTYEATIVLGKKSTTGDPEGEIIAISDTKPSEEQVLDALSKFIGEITQTPPIYSAIKINGERAYKLARKGADIEMPSRKVTIHNLELIDYSYPELKIRTHVSSGTYIRTLAEDIGESLGTGAYTRELRRLSIAEYSVADAQIIKD
jgi:tRNA pseudouridine55 synthase